MAWWGDGAGGGGMLVMVLAMAGFWALVVGVTVALFRGVHDDTAVRRRRSGAEDDPSQVREMPVARRRSHGAVRGPTFSKPSSKTRPNLR